MSRVKAKSKPEPVERKASRANPAAARSAPARPTAAARERAAKAKKRARKQALRHVAPIRDGILGIDCATRSGWAFRAEFGSVDLDAGIPQSAKVGLATRNSMILAKAMEAYGALMDRFRPGLVAIEAPFSRGLGTRLLYGLVAMAQAQAAVRGIPVIYEERAAVRKLALGNGAADKHDVLAWARGRGHRLGDWQTDEADALLDAWPNSPRQSHSGLWTD
jgi:Holliday junction resolvasome RuvABC endonuclease subunit